MRRLFGRAVPVHRPPTTRIRRTPRTSASPGRRGSGLGDLDVVRPDRLRLGHGDGQHTAGRRCLGLVGLVQVRRGEAPPAGTTPASSRKRFIRSKKSPDSAATGSPRPIARKGRSGNWPGRRCTGGVIAVHPRGMTAFGFFHGASLRPARRIRHRPAVAAAPGTCSRPKHGIRCPVDGSHRTDEPRTAAVMPSGRRVLARAPRRRIGPAVRPGRGAVARLACPSEQAPPFKTVPPRPPAGGRWHRRRPSRLPPPPGAAFGCPGGGRRTPGFR